MNEMAALFARHRSSKSRMDGVDEIGRGTRA